MTGTTDVQPVGPYVCVGGLGGDYLIKRVNASVRMLETSAMDVA